MTRWMVGIAAFGSLFLPVARGAHAQGASLWPRAGTLLVRVTEASVPPAPDITSAACAPRLRDRGTGREYMLRHSSVQTTVAQQQSGATTSTTTQAVRAVGDYARVERKGDTLSTRVVAVDCITARVVTRPAGT
jgi:hypothetical protein